MNQKQLTLLMSARAAWVRDSLSQATVAVCTRNSIEIPQSSLSVSPEVSWGDWHWHIRNRLRYDNLGLLYTLFPRYQGRAEELRQYLTEYDLSILPLNLLQPEGVAKFLPRLELHHARDPYGVQHEESVLLQEDGSTKHYLATHKRGYATFLPILGGSAGRVSCPIGCAGCYRGPQTRRRQPLRVIRADGSDYGVQIPDPVQQMQWLVEEWNKLSEFSGVYDVLLSGGEPLLLPNKTIIRMLQELTHAEHLKVLRICTGTLFLGLPFRFDDELIQILVDFREQTGIQVKISAHVSHPEHITPEAVHFARKIVEAGIEILPQCPLEPGVNFWIDDLDKTEATIRRLDQLLAIVIGTRGYKWILDMQGGVPLVSAIEIWRRLHDSHLGDSDITRPTSFALFLPRAEGNLNLSYHSLSAITSVVDRSAETVTYRIPHPSDVIVEYQEPLILGVNDNT